MEKGKVVISKAGRDKGQMFVVVNVKEDRIYICDGKIRKLSSPKSKNIKHLQKTNMFLPIDEIDNDRKLRIKIFELSQKCN